MCVCVCAAVVAVEAVAVVVVPFVVSASLLAIWDSKIYLRHCCACVGCIAPPCGWVVLLSAQHVCELDWFGFDCRAEASSISAKHKALTSRFHLSSRAAVCLLTC